MKNKFLLFLFVTASVSCSDKDKDENAAPAALGKGVFIVNEGTFGQANGSISYRSDDNSVFFADVYKKGNGIPLGDVVQSMYVFNSKGYIVVNNSQKVEVVEMAGFISKGIITGFSSPRFFLPVTSSKAYVTDWISNSVKVVDLNSNSVTGSIAAGSGPEQMALAAGKVYVVNVGGFGTDSTITIINASADTVLKTLTAGINPSSVLVDNNGDVVVLCSGSTGPDFTGGTADDLPSSIIKIDPQSDSIIYNQDLGQYNHPIKLQKNEAGDKFYFLWGDNGFTGTVCEYSFTTGMITPLVNETFYGLGIQPLTGNILCGRPGFTQRNYVVSYTSSGSLIDSVLAGIGPNSFCFN